MFIILLYYKVFIILLYYKVYDSALMEIAFVFINTFSKIAFQQKKTEVKRWQCCLKRGAKGS